jgi:hypothetical protein
MTMKIPKIGQLGGAIKSNRCKLLVANAKFHGENSGWINSFMTQSIKYSKPKKPLAIGLIRRTMTRVKSILDTTDKRTTTWLNGITGFIFGFSVAVGMGLNPLASLAAGCLASLCVVLSGSLVSFLIIQTTVLSLCAAISLLLFRLDNTWSVDAATFQIGFIAVVLLSPLVSLSPKVRRATNSFAIPAVIQLFSSVLF